MLKALENSALEDILQYAQQQKDSGALLQLFRHCLELEPDSKVFKGFIDKIDVQLSY